MYKDIIISILTARLFMQHPWYTECTRAEWIGLLLGTATIVFIFLLFLEVWCDKARYYIQRMRKKHRRVRKMDLIVTKLREERYERAL